MTLHWTLAPAADLRIQADNWNALNTASAALPFFDSRFLLPLLTHFGDGQELLALARDASGQTRAAALLQRRGFGRWTAFQPSQLPLGPWLMTADLDVVATAQSLLRALPGVTLTLGLTQLDPQYAPRPADMPSVEGVDYIDTAWVDMAGDWPSYWEARGKNLKSNLRKLRNRLEAEGAPPRFSVLTEPAHMASALAAYGRLEAAGWKAEGGTAIEASNAQGRFYTAMLEAFAAQGRAELWCLHLGEHLVAMDINILQGPLMVMLKTAYDPAFKQFSPAFLLKQEGFEREFGLHRLQRIEFYGKVLEWHTRWTESSRRLYHLNVDRWAFLRKWVRVIKP